MFKVSLLCCHDRIDYCSLFNTQSIWSMCCKNAAYKIFVAVISKGVLVGRSFTSCGGQHTPRQSFFLYDNDKDPKRYFFAAHISFVIPRELKFEVPEIKRKSMLSIFSYLQLLGRCWWSTKITLENMWQRNQTIQTKTWHQIFK